MSKFFNISGKSFKYVDDGPNDPRNNERRVQVALGKAFYESCEGPVLEWPSILTKYIPGTDNLTQAKRDNIGKRIMALDNFVSIADIETLQNAINVVKLVLDNAGSKNFLLIWPVGKNAALDNYAISLVGLNKLNVSKVYLRRDKNNDWEEVSDISKAVYGKPHPKGNALIVLTNMLEDEEEVEEQPRPERKSRRRREPRAVEKPTELPTEESQGWVSPKLNMPKAKLSSPTLRVNEPTNSDEEIAE